MFDIVVALHHVLPHKHVTICITQQVAAWAQHNRGTLDETLDFGCVVQFMRVDGLRLQFEIDQSGAFFFLCFAFAVVWPPSSPHPKSVILQTVVADLKIAHSKLLLVSGQRGLREAKLCDCDKIHSVIAFHQFSEPAAQCPSPSQSMKHF